MLNNAKCNVSGVKRAESELRRAGVIGNAVVNPSRHDGENRRHGRVLSAKHNRILRLTDIDGKHVTVEIRSTLAPFRLCSH